jgi:hypothetical protein
VRVPQMFPPLFLKKELQFYTWSVCAILHAFLASLVIMVTEHWRKVVEKMGAGQEV